MNKETLKNVAIAVSGIIGAAAGAVGTNYILNRKNNNAIEEPQTIIDVEPTETEE